jgi:hypothetical protein
MSLRQSKMTCPGGVVWAAVRRHGCRLVRELRAAAFCVSEVLRGHHLSPGADGAVVAAREGDAVDLVEGEEADPAVFLAHP